jgi:hypothetical protein
MNDQLQSVLLSILQSTVDTAGQIKDLVIEETPLVVQQLLMWKVAEAGFNIFIGVLLFVGAFLTWKGVFRNKPAKDEENWAWTHNSYGSLRMKEPGPQFALMGAAILCLASGVIVLTNVPIIIQILVAPKVYLIEYMSLLSRGV